MKIIITIFNVVVCVLMLAVALLFVTPLLPLENNIELRIVQSGSMEPSIMTGAVVLVVPHENYKVGDVITFGGSAAKVPTTHRIVEIYEEGGQSWFVTKGDANEEADTAVTPSKDIIGSVFVDVPYAGYVLDFSRQPLGFFFLIVLPALLIVFSEIEKIWSEIRNKKSEAKDVDDRDKTEDVPHSGPEEITTYPVRGQRMMDIGNPVRYSYSGFSESESQKMSTLKFSPAIPSAKSSKFSLNWKSFGVGVLILGTVIGINFVPLTMSYSNDSEDSTGNTLTAVSLDFKTLPDGQIYSFINGELSGDDDGALVTVVAPEAGSVPVRYNIAVEVTGGSQAFCDAIQAVADEPFIYTGSLTALVADGVYFDWPWSLNLSLPNSDGLNFSDTCQVDIVYTAWHYDEETDQGYFDEEKVPLSFTLLAEIVPVASFELQSFSVPLEEETPESDKPEPEPVIEPGLETELEKVVEAEDKKEITEPTAKAETEVEVVIEEVVDDNSDPVVENPPEETEQPEITEETKKEEVVEIVKEVTIED
ncbi:signal peptidase I [Candidatus Nomurabacteria bacterium]|nr:signal peptidase I [Candidatus Kaiserbacteria bacterium]MCB9814713.1 signal peptidase I [Candidatus Nomurabacteria bacterium]